MPIVYSTPTCNIVRSTMESTFVYIFYVMFLKEVICVDIRETCDSFDITFETAYRKGGARDPNVIKWVPGLVTNQVSPGTRESIMFMRSRGP